MSELTLLGLCGSLRAASLNRKLMLAAADRFGPAQLVEGDLNLPLYNGDLEDQGMPASVQRLSDQIRVADAVVVVTPEYNKGLSGVLKNALDWVSRTKPGPWPDKPVAVMSAAAGRAGGERAQLMLRSCLSPFRPRLLSHEFHLGAAANEFDAEGNLTSERYDASLTTQMQALRNEVVLLRKS
ncbi:MAG: NAD(P)H-dependent oxidoreductase [Rhodobacteraceae bacterium]|nr:NAD(P)H-dependent oxidoreductase [Paracoccaceae bacterium]